MSGTTFCCEQMRYAVEDREVPILYTPKFREYGIRILDSGSSVIELQFCPWCGQSLPGSLRDSWFEALEQLGIDPFGEDVPATFHDGRWYKQTGTNRLE